ncbi:hypothetical protein CROQUDRAFT_698172 [Cronartium quercuum f. sp. fusiforme G11]|uniref:Uncharacterized protein n=1 Tax=Cronartium quercuum f. sp. fusiforme G11 TaxID=708437 RepID=A0A9P6TGQ3_9BASI|nr:hypothetical protein CROQUDRAFT_698172 [Cronartium quercuum f. sp. fusiforme G11]
MRAGARGPVLIQIWLCLDFSSNTNHWDNMSSMQILEKAQKILNLMQGKILLNNSVEDPSSISPWEAEYTKDILIQRENLVSPSFQARLIHLASLADKCRLPFDGIVNLGDAIVATHIGLEIPCLHAFMDVLEQAGGKWYKGRASRCVVKQWPSNLPSVLVGKESLILRFYDLRGDNIIGLKDWLNDFIVKYQAKEEASAVEFD